MADAPPDDLQRSSPLRVLDHPPLRTFGRALVLVAPAWIAARLVVLAALALAHATVGSLRPNNPGAVTRVHQGLLAWDGGWYVSIARHGYAASGLQSVRFYPAFPMAGPALGVAARTGAGGLCAGVGIRRRTAAPLRRGGLPRCSDRSVVVGGGRRP